MIHDSAFLCHDYPREALQEQPERYQKRDQPLRYSYYRTL